jgi:hypothetical protein
MSKMGKLSSFGLCLECMRRGRSNSENENREFKEPRCPYIEDTDGRLVIARRGVGKAYWQLQGQSPSEARRQGKGEGEVEETT